MILKNVLLVVRDLERSRRFYQEVLGLKVTADFEEKVIFAGGVVLEKGHLWEDALKVEVSYGGNDAELYFEDSDIESIRKRLEDSDYEVDFLMEQNENPGEVIRFYDPDRHIIEVKCYRAVSTNH